jgi:hypothetical protein
MVTANAASWFLLKKIFKQKFNPYGRRSQERKNGMENGLVSNPGNRVIKKERKKYKLKFRRQTRQSRKQG